MLFRSLAVSFLVLVLGSSAAAQDVPARSFELHGLLTAGFAGSLNSSIHSGYGGAPGGHFPDQTMRPTPGGYLGLGYGFTRWFALEAGVGLLAFRTSDMKAASQGRELLFEAVLRPRLRWLRGPLELYLVAPIGLTRPLPNDDSAAAFHLSGVELKGKPSLTFGGSLGAAVQVSEHIALRGELGYQRHWLRYELEDVGTGTELGGAFHQLTSALGASYAF